MYFVLGFGAIVCAWSLLLILSGERQRRLAEALSPPAVTGTASDRLLAPAKTVDSRKKN